MPYQPSPIFRYGDSKNITSFALYLNITKKTFEIILKATHFLLTKQPHFTQTFVTTLNLNIGCMKFYF